MAIRSTLLERCERIGGYGATVLNIGTCKNADSLAWTAIALSPDARVISVRPVEDPRALGVGRVEVLSTAGGSDGLAEAIAHWRRTMGSRWEGPVVIDAETKERLIPEWRGRGSPHAPAGPSRARAEY